jgi:hypothetical protein
VATADLVLSRFPRHLDADAPGKVIGSVVGTLAATVESQFLQVGEVRRSHRLGELDQLSDLARLIALHGMGLAILDGLSRRVRAGNPAIAHDTWLEVARRMVVDLIVLQREESGTITGVLGAAATYLGLQVDEIDHDPDGYWHLARCSDRLEPGDPDAPAEWLLALEENPPRLADLGPSLFAHGSRFAVMRQGFENVPTTVVVKGVGDRSMRPMVVNIDDGIGFVATFPVPDGAVLRFERDGRVVLNGVSVARSCFTFAGAVFADAASDHPKSFVFGDDSAVFAVTHPVSDGFDPRPGLPHGDGLLSPLRLDRRETRFAVFVGAGTFGSVAVGGTILEAAPSTAAGRFDDSVFLPDPPPAGSASFQIGFEWDEREAYAVKVWIPREFQEHDKPSEAPIREVVRGLLDRHRAAGVHVYTEHADPRWTLGTGVIRDLDTDDALGVVVAGTEAWEDDIEQPEGGLP